MVKNFTMATFNVVHLGSFSLFTLAVKMLMLMKQYRFYVRTAKGSCIKRLNINYPEIRMYHHTKISCAGLNKMHQ